MMLAVAVPVFEMVRPLPFAASLKIDLLALEKWGLAPRRVVQAGKPNIRPGACPPFLEKWGLAPRRVVQSLGKCDIRRGACPHFFKDNAFAPRFPVSSVVPPNRASRFADDKHGRSLCF